MIVDLSLACDLKANMENQYDNPALSDDDASVDKCGISLELNKNPAVTYDSTVSNEADDANGVYIIPSNRTKSSSGCAKHCSSSNNPKSFISKNSGEKKAYNNCRHVNTNNCKISPNKDYKDYKNYDPYEHIRHNRESTTYLDTMFHLLKASLGTGILAMPNAFRNAGYVVGMVGTLFIGFLCTYNIHILLNSEYELCKRKKVPCMSYPETLQAAFEEGPQKLRWFASYAKIVGNMFLITYQLGSSAIYVIFISSNFQDVYKNYYGAEISIRVMMLYILVPSVLICWVPSLKLLVPFSTVANFVTMLSFSIMFFYIFNGIPSFENCEAVGKMQTIPLFFGTVLFAMEAIGVIMPLKNEMAKPKTFGTLFGVLNASMLPISLLYAIVGFFGYLKYKGDIRDSITLNLPAEELLANSVKIMYSASIYITYALSCYVAYEIIWMNGIKSQFAASKNIILWEYAARTGIAFLTFIMAAAVPNLEIFISMTGAFCLSTMGIAFPAIVQILVHWCHRADALRFSILIFKNIIIIMIAILAFTIGLGSSIAKLLQQT